MAEGKRYPAGTGDDQRSGASISTANPGVSRRRRRASRQGHPSRRILPATRSQIRSRRLAEGGSKPARLYAVHRERPFYDALVHFMTEGPVVVAALEREDAVAHLRKTMGATDSRKAEPGTVRAMYGTDIERNAIHGSDSPENAAKEVAFFFGEAELI